MYQIGGQRTGCTTDCGFKGPQHGGHSLNLPRCPPRSGEAHLLTWVMRGTWSPSSWLLGPAVLVLSAWSSSAPSPTAHMEGFRRISTPEEGMKGSGASAQRSAWGFIFDLLPSINEYALIYCFEWTTCLSLSSPKASHQSPRWASRLPQITWVLGLSCWEAAFFGTGSQVWVWGWCSQTTEQFELSSTFGSDVCLWNTNLFFFFFFSIYEDRKTHGSCLGESCRWMDLNATWRELWILWHSTDACNRWKKKKNFRWFCQ